MPYWKIVLVLSLLLTSAASRSELAVFDVMPGQQSTFSSIQLIERIESDSGYWQLELNEEQNGFLISATEGVTQDQAIGTVRVLTLDYQYDFQLRSSVSQHHNRVEVLPRLRNETPNTNQYGTQFSDEISQELQSQHSTPAAIVQGIQTFQGTFSPTISSYNVDNAQQPGKFEVLIEAQAADTQSERKQNEISPASSYITQKGDYLHKVARSLNTSQYSNSQYMAALFLKNPTAFDSADPELMYVGVELKLPTTTELTSAGSIGDYSKKKTPASDTVAKIAQLRERAAQLSSQNERVLASNRALNKRLSSLLDQVAAFNSLVIEP